MAQPFYAVWRQVYNALAVYTKRFYLRIGTLWYNHRDDGPGGMRVLYPTFMRIVHLSRKVIRFKRPGPIHLLPLVELLKTALFAKDPYTSFHSERVSVYLVWFAERVHGSLSETEKSHLPMAGWLHDIGKTAVPTEVLTSTGTLGTAEFAMMRRHPEMGYQIVRPIRAPRFVKNIVLYHHERYDGTGYPARLTGRRIPLEARMAALVDTFDAMTADRTYRPARSLDHALEEIIANSGAQFDPKLVEVFVQHFHDVRRLHRTLNDAHYNERWLSKETAT